MQRALGTIGRALLVGSVVLIAGKAKAQGLTQKPMPNVLLLVDTSGSMERMPDNSLPAENSAGITPGAPPNACSPGVESNPNRWGMLLQALTGNMQPYYSCFAQSRATGTAGASFRNEYKIANVTPYDNDYALPYHRPLTGQAANGTTCAIGPYRLPGAASGTNGVGPSMLGYATPAGQGGDVRDFPDDALISAKFTYHQSQYSTNNALGSPLGINACIFDQARDGQLDAARDYARFALMTFDNDTSNAIGVNGGTWPPQGAVQVGGGLPFLGQWSYRRDISNPGYNTAYSTAGSSFGLPDACAPPTQMFEVGAKHWGAPPWEGRMIEFPAEDASLADVQRVNERIQNVLLSSRPYGATPIDGMMDDARDYFWYKSGGPKDDAYIKDANCRDQYIILLTDGAPNLNLRPSCQTGTGICPFPQTAAQTAANLWGAAGKRVTTFVIGFSVNGESTTGGSGFPAPYNTFPNNNCKSWYTGLGGTPTALASACTSTPPPTGSTAEACCVLNEIAYSGTGGAAAPASAPAIGPFFAESQSDIVLSFGKILAQITRSVSTRTVPAFTPSVYKASSFNAGATTAQFIGSFIPNAQRPWSGELYRERSMCGGSPFKANPVTPSVAEGDSMAVNLAVQGAANRLFFTAVPDTYSGATAVGTPPSNTTVDAARTVRPFYPTTADGVPAYLAEEFGATDYDLRNTANIRLAMEIDRTTCKRGRADRGTTGTTYIPALDGASGAQDCTDVVMGFATGHAGALSKSGTIPGGVTASYDFNIRCTGSSPSAGRCSVSGAVCDTANPSACNPIPGQVCVPDCSPLGAIFRSNPVITGPPDALLRDIGYRQYQGTRRNRKPAIFVASTDGILHAFKAVETAANAHHELWSFIPPAVLPRLASNYPSGNQILLDGSPVVRDTVWDRGLSDLDVGAGLTPGAKWHTTLVAGLGQEGGGYYALNVTDSDCMSETTKTTSECSGTSGYEKPGKGNLDEAGAAAYDGAGTKAKKGPHFLWQLTDVPTIGSGETARVVRRSRDGIDMVALFGRQSGTPAIATVQLANTGGDRQVGVAILPGGLDSSPTPGATCPFLYSAGDSIADTASSPVRNSVRKWAKSCYGEGADDAVPGRGLTIVRLDNGRILRHFGRERDIPRTIWNANVVTSTPFPSPVTGTPVVYPQTIGTIAQKAYFGDADGLFWRLDLSSTDPANWKVQLVGDLIPTGGALASQPVQVAPVLSLDPNGALVINVATGDQENIAYKVGERNYVWSFQETRDVAPQRAMVRWYETLNDGERVTGPMTVFDRTLFFSSFAPRIPQLNQCNNAGTAKLWGLNYFMAQTPGTASSGGEPMWCSSITTNGICGSGTLTKNAPVDAALQGVVIPGVVLRPTQACSQFGNVDEGGTGTGFQSLTPSEFVLSFAVPKSRPPQSGFPPSVMSSQVARPLPRVSTSVNAWALVVD